MIENRAVGTNGDIHWRKHALQGKKVIFFVVDFFLVVEKLIKICRVGRVNRVGRVTLIQPFVLALSET